MDINNVTGCSGYGSTEGEMQESKNYITTQDVTDTYTFNSDSHSSIILWGSCHEEINHSELDLNSLSSESSLEICQPLNLCMRDLKNEVCLSFLYNYFILMSTYSSVFFQLTIYV